MAERGLKHLKQSKTEAAEDRCDYGTMKSMLGWGQESGHWVPNFLGDLDYSHGQVLRKPRGGQPLTGGVWGAGP